jgi:hypothetical protein
MMPRGACVPSALTETVVEITVRRLAEAMREEEGLAISDAILPERTVEKSPREVAKPVKTKKLDMKFSDL